MSSKEKTGERRNLEGRGGGCVTLNSSTRRQKSNSPPSTPEIEFPLTHKTASYANYGHGTISLIIYNWFVFVYVFKFELFCYSNGI